MDDDRNGIAETAKAFATYSLVPYLGILFCPGAVLMGGLGIARSYRDLAGRAGRRTCYLSLLTGVVVLGIQLLLWWILYKVPVWSKRM